MIFWDASALAKCYAPLEPDHARAKNLLTGKARHVGSMLLRPETTAAIVRRTADDVRLRNVILALLDSQVQRFSILPLDDHQVDLAVQLIRRHRLRAGDAVHVAAALSFVHELGRVAIRFATSDREQAAAARREGLKTIELAS